MRFYSRKSSNNILIGFYLAIIGGIIGVIVNRNGITHSVETIFFFVAALYLGIAIGQQRNARK